MRLQDYNATNLPVQSALEKRIEEYVVVVLHTQTPPLKYNIALSFSHVCMPLYFTLFNLYRL